MAGQGTLQGAVLKAMAGGGCLTPEDLAQATGRTRHQVVKAVGALISRGFVERVEIGCYRISPEGAEWHRSGRPITSGPHGPLTKVEPVRRKADALYHRLWRALRIKGKATVGDLLELAGADDRKVHAARKYLRALTGAGYVRRMPRREPGTAVTSNGFLRYQLIRDTGPVAPVHRTARGEVYDPNTGETTPCR